MADTIAAVATGGGVSAIGIVRISGERAIEAANSVFFRCDGKPLSESENRKLYLGELKDAEGLVIDQCLCTVSRGPESYTGENTAELQCHGSPVVLMSAMEALRQNGVRDAKAGEFTKRAFLNGRMDLTQAEAVIDLIDSETAEAARNAAGQLGRAISRRTDRIYDELVDIMSHFHAVIDYPDEDIDDFQMENYIGVLSSAKNELEKLLNTAKRGKILKNGVKCAIIGRPNTGKSSLMNALLGYERAIVTDIAGTTRDVIEEKVIVGGVMLRISDTAGIRETDDIVEKIGVRMAESAAQESDLVLAVVDGSEELTDEDIDILRQANDAPCSVAVISKSDLEPVVKSENVEKEIKNVCVISSVTGEGLEKLEAVIKREFAQKDNVPCGEILTNSRQTEAVKNAAGAIQSAIMTMKAGLTPDAVLTDVESALEFLGEMTGKTVRDDVTSRIFSRFCVGK